MGTSMDDQEILRMMKLSGRKKRSRKCLISKSSLTKENLNLNQLIDGEKTMVYALVEVSKDSAKTAKREKIPLSNKDFIQVMQKLITSKKDKPERKILKPSKRKHVSESAASFTTNGSKDEKNIQNDLLGLSDEMSIIYKRSNHSVVERLKRDRTRRRLHLGDHEIYEPEPSHLKILFSSNKTDNQEPTVKRDRINPVSRGTNTDIVQTPRVLEDALQAFTLNIDRERAEDSELDRKHFNTFDSVGCRATSPTQNFLLVPFIVSENQVSPFPKPASRDFTECVTPDRLPVSNDEMRKCLTDKQSEANAMNIDRLSNTTVLKTKTDQEESEEIGSGKNENQGLITTPINRSELLEDRDCLLKEVKALQKMMSVIVQGFETKNFKCMHSGTDKEDSNTLINELCTPKPTHDRECEKDEDSVQPNVKSSENHHYQDCGVQVVLAKSTCDKTITVPSGTAIKSLTDRLVQFPSQEKMEDTVQRGKTENPLKHTKVTHSKSSPNLPAKIEFRHVKRASSMMNCGKGNDKADYLHLANLNYEGSSPEDRDQLDDDVALELFRRKSREEPHRSEKCTNILFRKSNLTFLTENEKDKLVTVKPFGKVAKIRIFGNTTLCNENRDSGVRNIKLDLNELGSIKISNKFSRKTKPPNNNIICNNSNNNSTDSNSKIVSSNISNKDIDNKKKVIGKEAASKMSKREIVQKKVEVPKLTGSNPKTSAKEQDSPQLSPRASKLKKPSTPVRSFSRGKEDSSDPAKSSRTNDISKADGDLSKSPQIVKSSEKICEKKVNGSAIPRKLLTVPNFRKDKIPECGNPLETGKSPEIGKSREEVVSVAESSKSDKNSSPVKSIWALTKVVLYEDGSQSFEVLEASSQPLKYESLKKSENDDSESKGKSKTNDDCSNNSHSEGKTH